MPSFNRIAVPSYLRKQGSPPKNTAKRTRVKLLVESKFRRECVSRRRVPARVRLIRAEAALKTGRADEAAHLMQEILCEDSKHLGALETLAKSLWRMGKFEKVVETTDKLLALNPYEPGYHALRGAALQAQGRYGDAVQSYDRCRELPNSAEALRELQAWQEGLVSDMLASDPVFRASYRQNPQSACESMGFRFVEVERSEAWMPSQTDRVWTYNRPS